MTAVRQSHRNTASTTTTRTQPISSARLRLAIDISMNVAGRKMVESTATPASAGLQRRQRRLDIAGHLQGVAIRLLLDDQQQAGPSLMMPSPIGGGNPSTTSATSPIRRTEPARAAPRRAGDVGGALRSPH